MLESDQPEIVAVLPLKMTVPALTPKLLPGMVTNVPDGPLAGLMLLMLGASTVNVAPLLCSPPAVITTLPLLAPFGTMATMLVSDQLEMLAD